jgi:hypothetical protein
MKASSPSPNEAHPAPSAAPLPLPTPLECLERQWQEVKSRLTPTGAPYEWVFTTYDSRPRLTSECAPPHFDNAERFAQIAPLLQDDPAIGQRLAALFALAEPPAPVPLWVSGRGTSLTPDKVYVGMADAALALGQQWAAEYIGADYILAACASRLRMVGYDYRSKRVEFYYRSMGFEEWHLPLLLRRFGLGTDAAPLFALLQALTQRPVEDNLPRKMGFSISMGAEGGPPIFALHCLALALIGSDVTVRRRLLGLAEARNWDLTTYAAYSEPLVALKPVNPYHNIISLIYLPTGQVGLGIGIAPLPSIVEHETIKNRG